MSCKTFFSQRWREGTTIPENLLFTGRSGLLVDVDTPLDYFMVKDHMIETLVEENNRYSQHALMGKELSPRQRFKQWVEVTVGEMWAFLGLIVGTRLIVIENIAEY
ncbi:hypothetical protein RRG08_041899 [Elysia crispata]|uniref:Uncharacterized protein n=1 Tax=Elysia crispata TaxID=231223 RepID=A0AAE0ZUE7_9GAST|nr:hypothetical protein RRG08_041899 [Elysia crispata]